MNDALRQAITKICKQFATLENIDPAEINQITVELKRITGHNLNEDDFNLFMQFHYAHRQYQEAREALDTGHKSLPRNYVTSCAQEFMAEDVTLLSRFGLFAQTTRYQDVDPAPQLLRVAEPKKTYS
jgi:hypothetical protein